MIIWNILLFFPSSRSGIRKSICLEKCQFASTLVLCFAVRHDGIQLVK